MARLSCEGPPGMGIEILLRNWLVSGQSALLMSNWNGVSDFIEVLTRYLPESIVNVQLEWGLRFY